MPKQAKIPPNRQAHNKHNFFIQQSRVHVLHLSLYFSKLNILDSKMKFPYQCSCSLAIHSRLWCGPLPLKTVLLLTKTKPVISAVS